MFEFLWLEPMLIMSALIGVMMEGLKRGETLRFASVTVFDLGNKVAGFSDEAFLTSKCCCL